MSKSFKHVAEFEFPSEFGFNGSAGKTMVKGYARGGAVCPGAKAAVHKHEAKLHPAAAPTKLAKGGLASFPARASARLAARNTPASTVASAGAASPVAAKPSRYNAATRAAMGADDRLPAPAVRGSGGATLGGRVARRIGVKRGVPVAPTKPLITPK